MSFYKAYGVTEITKDNKHYYIGHGGNMGSTVNGHVKPNVDRLLGKGVFDKLKEHGKESGSPDYSYSLKVPIAHYERITNTKSESNTPDLKSLGQFVLESRKANTTHETGDCPKCERELESDRYCSHCDHYVDKKGRVTYNEAREPNKPYVKSHTQDGKHVGWKSSNKHGKVKYWQDFAKDSAMKHAGLCEDTNQNNNKPGSFEHFKHHVHAASRADNRNAVTAMWKHHDELQKHYKPDASYSRGTGLLDLDLGTHRTSDSDIRRTYDKAIGPKGKTASQNYK